MTHPSIAQDGRLAAYRHPVVRDEIGSHVLVVRWKRGPDDGPTDEGSTGTPEDFVVQFVREQQEALDNIGEPVGSFEVERVILLDREGGTICDLDVPGVPDTAGGRLRRSPAVLTAQQLRDLDLDQVISNAEDAFWAVIGRSLPGAEKGELSPDDALLHYQANRRALMRWLELHKPLPPLDEVEKILRECRPDWRPAVEHPCYIALHVAARRTFDVSFEIDENDVHWVRIEGDVKHHPEDGAALRIEENFVARYDGKDALGIAQSIRREVERWGY